MKQGLRQMYSAVFFQQNKKTIVALILLAFAWPASAGLTWEKRSVTFLAEPGVEALEATFAFINTGQTEVNILKVEAECNCTAAELEKTAYAPGESGRIAMVFTPGDRRGPQIKHLLIETDDPDQPRVTLEMRVSLREQVRVRPRLLMWGPDEPREPKEAVLTVLGRHPLELRLPEEQDSDSADRSATADGPVSPMSAILKTDEPGRRYRVVVSPPEDGLAHRAVIQLEADLADHQRLLPLRILARTVGESDSTSVETGPDDRQASKP